MRAAIYGAGAMGTVLGAFIWKNGGQIDLISRNTAHISALKQNGAHIIGTVDFVQKVSALTPDEMSGKYDIIFLMTKQRQNAEICEMLKSFLAKDGVVCTMQNGLPEYSVEDVLGKEHCLGCAVSWGATFKGNGVAELTSKPNSLTFSLGSLSHGNKRINEVASYLKLMGKVEEEQNFLGARWAKLSINSAFSSLSAITGLTFGKVAKGKKSKRVALMLLNEAFDVADKCGVTIEKIQGHDIVKIYGAHSVVKFKLALMLLPFAMNRHKNLVSGMYFDLSSGKQCDIDFINGKVAGMGKYFGVPTPVNTKVLEIAHKIENGELQISPENLKLILKDLK